MKTRSTSKSETKFYMLERNLKTMRPQDFDKEGKLSICKGRTTCGSIDVKEHLCGWACSCFLTRMNAVIAGILFLLIIWVLTETTSWFDCMAEFFTGISPSDEPKEPKTVEKFFEENWHLLLLVGPLIGCVFATAYYVKNCMEE